VNFITAGPTLFFDRPAAQTCALAIVAGSTAHTREMAGVVGTAHAPSIAQPLALTALLCLVLLTLDQTVCATVCAAAAAAVACALHSCSPCLLVSWPAW
jgi:hypothetical protein